MRKLNLIGIKFTKLTVVSLNIIRTKNKQARWDCICDCGNKITVAGNNLMTGHTQSCGCFKIERIKIVNTTHGHKPQHFPTATYTSWVNMKDRCFNNNNNNYHNYGGRGITVCDRWLESFENFLEDMGSKPKGTSIDRIDNNSHYCKENCRWATAKEQANNKRTNRYFLFYGNKYSLAQLCTKLNLKEKTVSARLDLHKWSSCQAFNQLVLPYKQESYLFNHI